MSTYIKAEKLKLDFQKALNNSGNKRYLIECEIVAIHSFVFEEPRLVGALQVPVYNLRSVFSPSELISVTHFPFGEAFDHFLNNGKTEYENNLQEYQKGTVKEAEQFAEYYQYLQNTLNEQLRPTNKKKSSFDHKEKLLALHYLGLDLSKFDNKKTAKILSEVIGHSEENTRKYLSYLTAGKNDVRTPKTLKNTLTLFESQGFIEISNIIKADLKKITK